MNKLTILSILLLTLPNCVLASDISIVVRKAKEEAKTLTIPENNHREKGIEAAEQSTELFQSDAFQKKLHREKQRLTEDIFSRHIHPWKKKQSLQRSSETSTRYLAEDEKVYLLFSSSVPLETMQSYINDIADTGTNDIRPIMQGWVGDLVDTAADVDYFSKLLKKNDACDGSSKPCEYFRINISLNSMIFTEYDVNRVPAVVYVQDNSAFRIQGDAGLDYLLERINRKAASPYLNKLIKQLRQL